jgi:hypothetical protein
LNLIIIKLIIVNKKNKRMWIVYGWTRS